MIFQVQMAVRKFVRIRLLGNSKHILAKKPIPLSALDNASIFHPDNSGGVVRIPSMNMNQSQRTMQSHTHSHMSSHHLQQSAKASPPPPPLVVRTYSNGVIKQTTLRVGVVDPHRHHNENLYHHDGRMPLLYKRNECVPPTTSPIIKPMTMTSSSAAESSANQEHPTKQRRIRIAQLSNWRMFIIPELLLRSTKCRRGNETATSTADDDKDKVASHEKEGKLGDASHDEEIENDNVDEDKAETDDKEASSSDYISIEINPGNSVSSVCLSRRSSFQQTSQLDNDEIDLDNEETQQLSMEIDIVVE